MRRPHRVEVDAAGHDRDVHLVGCELGRRHLTDVQALARVLVVRCDAGPHLLLGLQHMCTAVAVGNRQRGDIVSGRLALDRVQHVLHRALRHGRTLPTGSNAHPMEPPTHRAAPRTSVDSMRPHVEDSQHRRAVAGPGVDRRHRVAEHRGRACCRCRAASSAAGSRTGRATSSRTAPGH